MSDREVQGLRERFAAVHENKLFQAAVIFVILVSALVIGAKTYEVPSGWVQVLVILDTGITLLFLAEIIVRMAAERGGLKAFFRRGWNVFDFLIVTMSLIPVEGTKMALLGRLLRIFRVLRLVSLVPELQVLIAALVKAIPRMGYVALLMFIIFYIYGAFGSFLFEGVNRELWGDIAISMLTLFRVATFEDWTDVMYETMSVYPLSRLYYVSFIFLAAFVFLNMMIGVVVDVIQREHAEHILAETEEGVSGQPGAASESLEARLERIEHKLDSLVDSGVGPERPRRSKQ